MISTATLSAWSGTSSAIRTTAIGRSRSGPAFCGSTAQRFRSSDRDSPALVCRRQTALACRASTQLTFEPTSENEEAGLVVRGNDANHFEVGVTMHDGRRQVFYRQVLGGKTIEPVRYEDAPAGDVVLTVAAKPLEYEFFYRSPDGSPVSLGTAKTQDLSSEKIGGFTGAFIGMYATGNGKPSTVPADFDWFEYTIQDR